MTQPILTDAQELATLLARYDTGAMPPGIAARVAELRRIIAARPGRGNCGGYDG
jgi:hypothetical protein